MKLLSRTEEFILLAVLYLKDEAYSVLIRKRLQDVTGKTWSYGALFISLDPQSHPLNTDDLDLCTGLDFGIAHRLPDLPVDEHLSFRIESGLGHSGQAYQPGRARNRFSSLGLECETDRHDKEQGGENNRRQEYPPRDPHDGVRTFEKHE